MGANNKVGNFINDLRVSESNINSFLSIDDNCKVKWVNSITSSAGEVWQYEKIEADCYVTLPVASLYQGYCVALMRTLTASGDIPKVFIIPSEVFISTEQKYDYIQGVSDSYTFYYSSGIDISTTGKITTSSNDNDNYSSIILKSISMGNDSSGNELWGWVIVNGVGSWYAGDITLSNGVNMVDIITSDSTLEEMTASAQTAGVTTLSSSVNECDSVFVPFKSKTSPITAYCAARSTESPISLYASDDNNLIYNISNYVSSLQDAYTLNRGWFTKSNALSNSCYTTLFQSSADVANLNDTTLAFGRIYGDGVGTYDWQTENQKYCITKALGNYSAIDLNGIAHINVIAYQWRFNVNLEDFNSETISINNIKNIYMNIFSDLEDYKVSYILYKVNKDYTIIDSIDPTKVIELYRNSFLEMSGASYTETRGTGSLITIPIEDGETEFDIVLEVLKHTTDGFVYSTDYSKTYNFVVSAPQNIDLTFVGAECLRSVSISPDVGFGNLGIYGLPTRGTLSSNIITDGYLDKEYLESSSFVGTIIPESKISNLTTDDTVGFDIDGNPTSFFNKNGYFKPDTDVSKTVLEYTFDLGERLDEPNSETLTYGGSIIKAKLTLDWVNSKYLFTANGFAEDLVLTYACSSSGSFSDTQADTFDLTFYKNSGSYVLRNALKISSLGLTKLPFYTFQAGSYELLIDILNYKTITTSDTSFRTPGELITSTILLEDDGLHLADGSILTAPGTYSDFISYMADLYVAGNNENFCTETEWQESVSKYGVCGKYVYYSSSNSIRLPLIKGFLEGVLSDGGSINEAGLPNITGTANGSGTYRSSSGAFSYSGSTTTTNQTSSSSSFSPLVFNASDSNSIYGNSTTVQPQSTRVYYYIAVATSIRTNLEVNVDVEIEFEKITSDIEENTSNISTLSNNAVLITGNQNVAGVKTFTSLPTSTVTPTSNYQLTNKSYVDTQVSTKADDDEVVKLTGTQIIAGVKTFNSSPIVPTPTTSSQVANKNYVDNFITVDTELSDTSTNPVQNKVVTEAINSISSLIPATIITSTVEQTDSGLHLADGTLLSGSGTYGDFVSYMANKSTEDSFCTEVEWQASVSSYGVCGKYVYSSSANTLRLPKIIGFIEGTSSDIGVLNEAGLPNIKAGCALTDDNTTNLACRVLHTTGAIYSSSNSNITGTLSAATSTGYNDSYLNFDASLSNSIYGNSTTVQPQSVKVYYYLVVGTVTKTDIEIDIDEITNDLNGKLSTDLGNATVSIQTLYSDYSDDEGNWYNIYKRQYTNGTIKYWCEQGARLTFTDYLAFTFLVPFNSLTGGYTCRVFATRDASYLGSLNVYNISTTGANVIQIEVPYSGAFSYIACGFIDKPTM